MAPILIVDDEFAIVETLAEVLRWEGYQVRTAANGQLALEAMRLERPSLVLLDYMMPVMDGAQTLAAMRADPLLAAIPVIVMSAAPENVVMPLHTWDGIFLRKPFRAPALLAAIVSTRAKTPGQ